MARYTALTDHPSLIPTSLGGAAATILLSALLFLAPVFGFPFIDFPRLVGGLFTADPETAFGLGFGLFFITGWLIFAPALAFAWKALPGDDVRFTGALLKGVLWGLILWGLSGLLLPLFGAWNRLEGLQNPGFFALGTGLLGALAVLLGHLAYGVVVALVAAMGQGISPMDTLGWMGHAAGREA